MWFYSCRGENVKQQITEALNAALLSRSHKNPTCVAAYVAAFGTNGDGQHFYICQHPQEGHVNVEIDCDSQAVKVTSVYQNDPDREFASFEKCIEAFQVQAATV